MKNTFLLLICLCSSQLFAQGNFAPADWKPLIGKTFNNENEVAVLKGFTSRGGSLLTNVDDEEKISSSLFSKGATVVLLFEKLLPNNQFTILDLMEVKNVLKTQEIKVGDCSDGENNDSGIIALVNQTDQERWKAIKAWHFNKDKIRIEPWSPQRVTCWGMVGDN
ncbi:MAG: hypothetical protein ACKVOQ_12115 [Cyclobacteriaceae bacterium]